MKMERQVDRSIIISILIVDRYSRDCGFQSRNEYKTFDIGWYMLSSFSKRGFFEDRLHRRSCSG
jgi:hypothetical protein